MSELTIREPHKLGAAEARKKVADFEQLLQKYQITPKWSGNRAEIKSMAVSGSINVTDTDVTIQLKLGMMARAAGIDATKLEGSIRKRLKAAFETT